MINILLFDLLELLRLLQELIPAHKFSSTHLKNAILQLTWDLIAMHIKSSFHHISFILFCGIYLKIALHEHIRTAYRTQTE
jgi:hypothetical protein